MRNLIRIILLMLLVTAAISVIRGVAGALASTRGRSRVPGSKGAGHLVKDPVCGTYVPESTAIHAFDHAFCSEECRGRFRNSDFGARS
jgi:YHS domain-containing protein